LWLSEETRAKIVEVWWQYGMKGPHGLDVLAPHYNDSHNDKSGNARLPPTFTLGARPVHDGVGAAPGSAYCHEDCQACKADNDSKVTVDLGASRVGNGTSHVEGEGSVPQG